MANGPENKVSPDLLVRALGHEVTGDRGDGDDHHGPDPT